jgi:selenocysteine-specific translation elongation factor
MSPARVGLAVKGVKPEDVGRGDIICQEDKVLVNSEIELEFTQSPFYKNEISEGQMCLVSVGLQIKAAKFSSINPLKLIFEKQIAYHAGDIAVILKPESTTIRILGSGPIQ